MLAISQKYRVGCEKGLGEMRVPSPGEDPLTGDHLEALGFLPVIKSYQPKGGEGRTLEERRCHVHRRHERGNRTVQ